MQNKAVPILALSSIFWGLSWIPLKYLNELGVAGVPITFLVYSIMLGITTLIAIPYRHQIAKNWKPLGAIFFLGGGALLSFNTAMIYGDVIRVMVLFYILPLWGVLGGRFILKEQITPLRWLGMGFSIVGAFLVVDGINTLNSEGSWLDGLALLAGFLFAMNNIAFRASEETPVVLKLHFMFLGTVVLSMTTLMYLQQPILKESSLHIWTVLVAFAVFWMLLTNFATQWAVTKIDASKSSIIMILELVAAVISASLILNTHLNHIEILGALLIIIAAIFESIPTRQLTK